MYTYQWQARKWTHVFVLSFPINVINAFATFTKYKSWIKYAFMTCKIHVHFLMRMSLNNFSSIACNSVIISNKQKQEQNSKEPTSSPRASSLSYNQMQILTRMKRGVIEDLLQHDSNWWKCELDKTIISIVKKFSKCSDPLLYIYLYFKRIDSLFKCTQ